MTKIAWFSTDWTSEPVPDFEKSRLTGKPEFVPGKQTLTFGGTYYYRGAMPAMELTKHGYECILSWRMEARPDGGIRVLDTQGNWHDDCDVVWFQRWMHKDGAEQFKRAKAAGQVIINDLDDQFWALPKTNIAHDTTDPAKSPDFNRDHYRRAIAESSAIIVSTDPLRREVERLGPPVHVVRNAIDLERWHPHDPGINAMIGWIGGIQWRAKDLHILRPIMREFLTEHELPFYHGGDSQVPGVEKAWDQLGLNPQETPIAAQPLCHISQYPRLWEPIGVALVPLENCRFNQGKSYLKSLEACAAGVPYIVSDGLPEQHILINEGSAGRLARNDKPQTWRKHLEELLDPEVRRAEGKQNRAVAELHNISERWRDWDEVFSEYGRKPTEGPATD